MLCEFKLDVVLLECEDNTYIKNMLDGGVFTCFRVLMHLLNKVSLHVLMWNTSSITLNVVYKP